MKLKLFSGFIILGLVINFSLITEEDKEEKKIISFKNDVFPIIEANCLPCHARAERNMSRLYLDNYQLLMKGGYNGTPVKVGKAEESLIIKKLSENPPFGEQMPMRSKEYLSDEEIEIIARWINEGAKNN